MWPQVKRPADPLAATALTDEQLVRNYRDTYGLDDRIGRSEAIQHIRLEHDLTSELLRSTPDDRWEVFSSAYTRLYEGLPWLAGTGSDSQYDFWKQVLKPGSRILEIGSGAARLLRDLARHGHTCVATEITEARGERVDDGIAWHVSDGVNLDKFEEPGTFDHVISDNVVEHLHPDDIVTHFASARRLLRDGGSYVVRTPHRSTGPTDLSKVLEFDEAVFMHLHEFKYADFGLIKREAGYSSIAAVFQVPRLHIVRASRLYYWFMLMVDAFEERFIKTPAGRRKFRAKTKWICAPPSVWIELRK